jgi:hypothetical protein
MSSAESPTKNNRSKGGQRRWASGNDTPHPYFGNKILVFLKLREGLRCKIVKTKELFAKSSRIRSYVWFQPLLEAFG